MSVDIDFEAPRYPCPVEVGDTVLVTGLLCAKNDVGGTLILNGFTDRSCEVTRFFWDYETGWRIIGRLVDENDVAEVRARGTTGYTAGDYREKFPGNDDLFERTEKAQAEFDPAVVYFGDIDIYRPTFSPGR